MTTETEHKKRDAVLDRLERLRANAIFAAKQIAANIYDRKGRVTSVEVMREMGKTHPSLIADIDPRFMGAVFRRGLGWKRIGWETTGSHGRPVAIWGR